MERARQQQTKQLLIKLICWAALWGHVVSWPMEAHLYEMMRSILGVDSSSFSGTHAASIPCDESLPLSTEDDDNYSIFDEDAVHNDFELDAAIEEESAEQCVELPAPPLYRPKPPVSAAKNPCFVRVIYLRTPMLPKDPCINFTQTIFPEKAKGQKNSKTKTKKCGKKGKNGKAAKAKPATTTRKTTTTQTTTPVETTTVAIPTAANETTVTTTTTTTELPATTTTTTTTEQTTTTTEPTTTSTEQTTSTTTTAEPSTTEANLEAETTTLQLTTTPTTTTVKPTRKSRRLPKKKMKKVTTKRPTTKKKSKRKNSSVPDKPKIMLDGLKEHSEVILVTEKPANLETGSGALSNSLELDTTTCIYEFETTTEKLEEAEAEALTTTTEPCFDTEEQDTNLCPQFIAPEEAAPPAVRPSRFRKTMKNYVEPILYEGHFAKSRQRAGALRAPPQRREYIVSNNKIMARPRPKPRYREPHSIYMNNIVRGLKCTDAVTPQPRRPWGLRRVRPAAAGYQNNAPQQLNYRLPQLQPRHRQLMRGVGDDIESGAGYELPSTEEHLDESNEQYFDDGSMDARLLWAPNAGYDPCEAERRAQAAVAGGTAAGSDNSNANGESANVYDYQQTAPHCFT